MSTSRASSAKTSKPIGNGIRSVCRKGEGAPLDTARYEALVLCTDLANKKMHPAINTVSIRTVEEAGGLSRHAGEEFVYVLDGVLDPCQRILRALAA